MVDIDIYFRVQVASGIMIRTTRSHWNLIINVKHPEIANKEEQVQKCLADPLEIRRSSEDVNVYLYYVPQDRYYLCVVARHLNGDGFIITAYLTDKIKEGETIWKK